MLDEQVAEIEARASVSHSTDEASEFPILLVAITVILYWRASSRLEKVNCLVLKAESVLLMVDDYAATELSDG